MAEAAKTEAKEAKDKQLKCGGCSQNKLEKDYSTAQLKKKGKRKCADCVKKEETAEKPKAAEKAGAEAKTEVKGAKAAVSACRRACVELVLQNFKVEDIVAVVNSVAPQTAEARYGQSNTLTQASVAALIFYWWRAQKNKGKLTLNGNDVVLIEQ